MPINFKVCTAAGLQAGPTYHFDTYGAARAKERELQSEATLTVLLADYHDGNGWVAPRDEEGS